jgi:hypothetical protein
LRSAKVLFEEELRKRAIGFVYTRDGRYEIDAEGGGKVLLSLDNVSRDYERDGDPGRIVRFVDTALGVFSPLPPWRESRSRIYWSAEPCSSEGLDEVLCEKITGKVCRVLVLAVEPGRIRWLTSKCLESWRVDLEHVRTAAGANLDDLLGEGRLHVEASDGLKLGMLEIDSAFKASLIFAPKFKGFVEADLGWPVLAVIPCRDFIYVFPEGDSVLGRLGGVVQEEFRKSAYPITTEVLRISDEGIEAIGHFPE